MLASAAAFSSVLVDRRRAVVERKRRETKADIFAVLGSGRSGCCRGGRAVS